MNKTVQQILDEGKKCGFATVEAFGEKIEKEEYRVLTGQPKTTAVHTASTQQVTARAFGESGPPLGFRMSRPGLTAIKKSFSSIYAVNLRGGNDNHAGMLPSAAGKENPGIYDNTIDRVNDDRFNELVDQMDEIMISSTFKGLELKKIHLTKRLKKKYIANTNGLNLKYIKTQFDLLLSFSLEGNHIDTGESRIFFQQIEPFKLISRAYNLLQSLTETMVSTERKSVFLVLSPEASAFLLREFAGHFMIDSDRRLRDIPFPAVLNIVDDPSLNGGVGSAPVDDEGVSSGEKYLVKKGALQRFISHIESAFRAGLPKSSGNGFRGERSMFPAVRFSNLYMKPTVLSLKNLMEDAGDGFLVSLLKLKYMEKDAYVFSAYGYRFKNGQLLEPVHFYIRTTSLSYFLNIRKISKEIKFFNSVFNVGSPYVLLEGKNRGNHLFEI